MFLKLFAISLRRERKKFNLRDYMSEEKTVMERKNESYVKLKKSLVGMNFHFSIGKSISPLTTTSSISYFLVIRDTNALLLLGNLKCMLVTIRHY